MSAPQKEVFQNYTRNQLSEFLFALDPEGKGGEEARQKRARYRAKQIFHWVYQRHVCDWSQMSDLSIKLRERLADRMVIVRLETAVSNQSLDGTQKFLWKLSDTKTIESVIIPAALKERVDWDGEGGSGSKGGPKRVPVVQRHYPIAPSVYAGAAVINTEDPDASDAPEHDEWKRLTACISSQVGCAMACQFCLTGIQGLDRSLQAFEIVTQVLELRMRAPITNIVFMGMGEPLHNLDAVSKACEILIDPDGLAFSKRKVTVSTSGLVPAIEELGRRVDVSLAISLNATTDEVRSKIMPVNRKWNIATLLETCRNYPLGPHRRITFEYVLLKDVNDSLEDARRLVGLLRGIPSKVNLIPFNQHPGSEFQRPDDDCVRAFQRILIQAGYTATVRISRGRDILAACGQLRSIFGSARGTEKHRDYAASSDLSDSNPSARVVQDLNRQHRTY